MKSRKLLFASLGLLIILIGVSVLPWKNKIDTTVKAFQLDINDPEYSENISVVIKGVYNRYLFRNDTFNGDIYIETYDYTYNSVPLNLSFDDNIANLIYIDKENILKINSLGFLICNSNFEEIFIGVNTPLNSESNGWSKENGIIICGNAKTREEAIDIAKSLSEKSKWLSKGNPIKKM